MWFYLGLIGSAGVLALGGGVLVAAYLSDMAWRCQIENSDDFLHPPCEENVGDAEQIEI